MPRGVYKREGARPKAALLDAAGMASLARLMRLEDEADAQDWPIALAREARLQESAILRNARIVAGPTGGKAKPAASSGTDPEYVFRRVEWIRSGRPKDAKPNGGPVTAKQVENAAILEPERWAEMRARTGKPRDHGAPERTERELDALEA
jgi:hypothetical protein